VTSGATEGFGVPYDPFASRLSVLSTVAQLAPLVEVMLAHECWTLPSTEVPLLHGSTEPKVL